MEELATERTAIMITAFMTESRPWIPASLMAMMKGEVLEATTFRERRSGLLYGTRRPIIIIEIT
jgi:hypothetical protein